MAMLFDFVTVLDGFSHDQIRIKAHTMSQQIYLACEMNQGLPSRVGQPKDLAVIPGDVEMQGEEFEVGVNDENPNFQHVPDQPSDENPSVESQSPQSSEPRLPHPRRRITSQQFERNVRARQSTSSFHTVPSSEAALACVEVNIKKLSGEERAQFRAAPNKEMDQWISNDVFSACQRADIPKQRVMTIGFTLGKWLRTQEKRRQKQVFL